MNAPLAILTNRLSTGNRRAANWIDPLLADQPDVLHIPLTDVAALDDAIGRFEAVGARTIVVNGGDGTAGLVFGALLNGGPFQDLPAIALLPGGKTNMTAAGWSLTGAAPQALRDILVHHRAGTLHAHAHPRAVMSVCDGDAPARYGAFFGAADIVEGIRFCRKHIYPLRMPNALSHTAAISLLMWRSLFATRQSKTIQATSDAEVEIGGKLFVLVATTLEELILGLKPLPPADAPPGALLHVGVEHSRPAILRALPDVLRGTLRSGRGRTVGRSRRITLRLDGAYTIDGEMYETHSGQDLIIDSSDTLRFIRFTA